MDVLIYSNDDVNTDEIISLLVENPLPEGYIYTLVSYLTPDQVRVQAMQSMLANAILDTGERVSETADTLQSAIDALIIRLSPDNPFDVSRPFDGTRICKCQHFRFVHDDKGQCGADNCPCTQFEEIDFDESEFGQAFNAWVDEYKSSCAAGTVACKPLLGG